MVYDRSPSSEGVQRDLLPLIEGTVVNTKYGKEMVKLSLSKILFKVRSRLITSCLWQVELSVMLSQLI